MYEFKTLNIVQYNWHAITCIISKFMVALILEFECDTRGALDEHTLLDYYTLWLIDLEE